MSSLLFLAMLIGVLWLCVWSVLPQDGRRPLRWWPFDMADVPPGPAPPSGRPGRWQRNPPAAPPGAHPASTSWRDRRRGPRQERRR